MSEDEGVFTDEMAEKMWGGLLPLIEEMTERTQNPGEFVVEPRSQLAADDAKSHPYEVSHCARMCLNAGVDHMHAAKSLMFDANKPLLHASADWSLIRGALENLAAAFWILHPAQRTYRIEHALRWMVKNFKDQGNATDRLDLPNSKTTDEKVERVLQIGTGAGCKASEVRRGYFSTTVLKYVEKYSGSTNPYLMWQLCSGFAHGRPWASLSMNDMEILDSNDGDGVLSIKLTSDYKRILAAAWPAGQLMHAVVWLYMHRAKGVKSA